MSKVLVDPAALEEAAKWLEVHSSSSGSAEAFAAEALREAIAQPAETEGEVEMGSDAWMALHLLDRLDVSADEEPRVQQVEEIVRRMGAALSAVTAERDNYKSWYDDAMDASNIAGFAGMSAAQVIDYQDKEIMRLRAEVEGLRKDAERYRWLRYADLDALAEANWGLEGEVYQGDEFDRAIDAAMAAKEA